MEGRPRPGRRRASLHRLRHRDPMGCRAVVALVAVAFGSAPVSRAGTLFGVQFQGDGTDLYALPTVDPTIGKSLVQDMLPIDYQSNAIALGSTGMRRFRKVGTPALGRDGPVAGEGRESDMYYNIVPKMSDPPDQVTEAQSIEIDAQTGDVVVHEVTMGPLMAFQFTEDGDMFGLLPAETGGASGGVQVKFFRDLEYGTGTPVEGRKWEELGRKSFDDYHAVFGLSAMDRARGVFYCLLYNPSVGLLNGGKLFGLKMPEVTPTGEPAELEDITNGGVDVPPMLSSLAHDHATNKLFGVAWDNEVKEHRLVEIDPEGSTNPCANAAFEQSPIQSNCPEAECDFSENAGGSPVCEQAWLAGSPVFGLKNTRGDYQRLNPILYTAALDQEEPLYYQMLHDSSVGTCLTPDQTPLAEGWLEQACVDLGGHTVYRPPQRFGPGDTTVGECLRCATVPGPEDAPCGDDPLLAEEIHIRVVCESREGHTWTGVGGIYADHRCVPKVHNDPPDDCSFRDRAECEGKPACAYIPSSGGVNPSEPGSTVLFEMNASAGTPTFRQPMEPGFVDLFVMPAPSIARLEPKTGPFEGNTTITVVGDYMVKSAKVSCQFDYTAGVAYPGDAGTTVMYGGDLIVDWTRDSNLWSRDLIGLNGTDETTGAFADYNVICRSPPRDDWLRLPETGFYSKLNVTQDMIDFRVGILAQEWSEPLDFQFYRQPIIKHVEPRHGPLSGNTTVTFHGHYFYDTHTITCSFGDRRGIVGTFDNITRTVTCVSPNQTQTGSVPVEIALNGQQYTNNGVKFTYYEPASAVTVTEISPRSGPTTGATTVVVTGEEFLETNETKCMFGDIVVDAIFRPGSGAEQAGQIVCVSPPCCYDDATGRNARGTVNFEIALNGQQYTTSGLSAVNFRFYEPPTVRDRKSVV